MGEGGREAHNYTPEKATAFGVSHVSFFFLLFYFLIYFLFKVFSHK